MQQQCINASCRFSNWQVRNTFQETSKYLISKKKKKIEHKLLKKSCLCLSLKFGWAHYAGPKMAGAVSQEPN